MMTVVASILDPVRDTLDPTVWDAVNEYNPVLKPQHRDWIIDTVISTLKRHGYGDMDKWLEVYLTGSLTTFQYSDDSDCDVSLFVNTDVFPEWSRAEMIGIFVSEVDGTTLPGTTHPMQCYVVAKGIRSEDLYKPGLRSGYQIQNDRWVVPPERERSHDVQSSQNADYQYALEQADKMDRLLRYEPHKAVQFWHQIHLRRMSDQKAGKGDYAQSNIIYKFLANRGLFPKLEEATGEHIAGMTLPQEVRQWKTMRPFDPYSVVHKFGDGWTIQNHPTTEDVHDVGQMMHNCWQDEEIEGDPEAGGYYYALHDPHDIPRVAFYYDHNGGIDEPYGRNNRPLKPEHAAYLQTWRDLGHPHIDPDEHTAALTESNPLPRSLDDHWLTWQPGTEGKGFILENGRVWTWPTTDLRPMHLNRSAPVKSMGGSVRPETAFHINPDGGIFQVGPGRHLNHLDHARLAMADRRLRPIAPPTDTEGYGHSQDVYEKLRNSSVHTAAFFNDDQEPSPEILEEFGPEYDLERQRRNQLRALPNVMYHVAPTNRRADIAAKGLVPDAERINNESGHEPGVYLWEDPEVAMKYRGQGPNMYSDFDMYAVQAPREHLKPDPWFEQHHQDRAKDFPGAWYSPNAMSPEHVHPFYDSPWHPRTAGAPESWSINPDAIEKARAHMGLRFPVEVNLVQGTHGQYRGAEDGTHKIDLVSWLNPESASKQLWHEMTHALQQEREPQMWPHHQRAYDQFVERWPDKYQNHPWEVEARQTAETQPFPLVHGVRVQSSLSDASTTNKGLHVGYTEAHDTSQPPSEEAWSFC
jgi:hypothetical protein